MVMYLSGNNPTERNRVMDMFDIWRAYELVASPTEEENEKEDLDWGANTDEGLENFCASEDFWCARS